MTDSRGHFLLQHLLDGATVGRVSVIGLSKNAGKTVTLNHLVRAATEKELPLGLASTGRDGEEHDAITELPKPRIWAPTGALIATAAGALPAATARVKLQLELPVKTPFGPVVLGRVEAAGNVLLIGPGSSKRMAETLEGLESLGARLCLVDGSFNRIAAASPAVAGQVVLAAGAAFSSNMGATVAQIRHILDVFDLPPVLPAIADLVDQAAQLGPVSVVTLGGSVTRVPVDSALGDPAPIVAAVLEQALGAYLVMTGALSDQLLTALLKRRIHTTGIVVPDPTHVLVDRDRWRRWRHLGGQVYVRQPARLVAITTNPHSPVGQDYHPLEFFRSVQAVANRPVYDLEAGLPEA